MTSPRVWPQTPITALFGTASPLVQAGMVWVSGGKLAAAAANAGCLGLIGAGSMDPELLRHHIQKAQVLTDKPFGINLPLLYSKVAEQIDVALEQGIRIFFTSAGSPKTWTGYLKKAGAVVVHVTSSLALAQKCEDAGVDAVVVEGFEAGGHNGREELTSLVLLQQLRGRLSIPVIAAGGFGTGHAVLAALALGAQGVQLGTRFVATQESSAHENYKQRLCQAGNETFLRMKKTVPVRLLKNDFAERIAQAEDRGASADELLALLGKGRAKSGMLLGDLAEGELEIGQIVSLVQRVSTCEELVEELYAEYRAAVAALPQLVG